MRHQVREGEPVLDAFTDEERTSGVGSLLLDPHPGGPPCPHPHPPWVLIARVLRLGRQAETQPEHLVACGPVMTRLHWARRPLSGRLRAAFG